MHEPVYNFYQLLKISQNNMQAILATGFDEPLAVRLSKGGGSSFRPTLSLVWICPQVSSLESGGYISRAGIGGCYTKQQFKIRSAYVTKAWLK